MNKRGEGTGYIYYVMIGLVFAAIIILTMFDISHSLMRKDIVENVFLARDVALVIDALHATPDEVFYTYPAHLDSRVININKSAVRARSQRERSSLTETYFYRPSSFYKLSYPDEIPAYYFDFYKKDGIITIGNYLDSDEDVLVKTYPKENLKIKISYDQTSLDSAILKSFAMNLKSALENKNFVVVAEGQTIELKIDDDSQRFTIYYAGVQKEESKTLATKIKEVLPSNIVSSQLILVEDNPLYVTLDFSDLTLLKNPSESKRLALRISAAFELVYI